LQASPPPRSRIATTTYRGLRTAAPEDFGNWLGISDEQIRISNRPFVALPRTVDNLPVHGLTTRRTPSKKTVPMGDEGKAASRRHRLAALLFVQTQKQLTTAGNVTGTSHFMQTF